MTSTSIYTPITPTYLYIKQHSVTKKKYFGKTTRDPYTYNGSGKVWTRHINKHGKEHIVTLWVSDLYYDTSIVEVALKFSADNDIVNSKEWVNMEPENGLNGWVPGRKRGPCSEETKAKKRKPQSEEQKAKKSVNMTGKKRGLYKPRSDKGKPRNPCSEETKAKLSASTKGVPKPEGFGAKVSASTKGVPKPEFFSIIATRKTYNKQNLSRQYPEFKQFY